ncbi:Cytochrome c oxidase polypeptide 5, mitochondrial [Smittium culicis]|uniref:Cytochrome c oxidase polypeptide 5, mitochondrial n=1 Tax=Smittium culicis TaxID=133412 RepID=A0A1R1XFB4_9FUNG|nr:Cytochrome c oxidase polypeptide 5, mitochondrial [Smittium culicis]
MNSLIASRISRVAFTKAAVRPMTTASAAPVISQIENSWVNMAEQEKASVVAKLETVMKNDWTAVDLSDKRAIYYIDYGNYATRAPTSKKGDGLKILAGTSLIIGASIFTSYMIHLAFGSRPVTMTKEWQEESNKYAIEQNQNPISGISSKGYQGSGHISNL